MKCCHRYSMSFFMSSIVERNCENIRFKLNIRIVHWQVCLTSVYLWYRGSRAASFDPSQILEFPRSLEG